MKVLLFANTAWYLYNFRRSLAASLRQEGYEVMLASPPDAYGEELIKLGFKWLPVPMLRRSVNPLRELRLLWWLKAMMQREGIQLVHSFTLKCAIYGSIAARMAGVPGRINAVAGLGFTFTRNGPKARALRLVAGTMLRMALGGQGVKLILQNPDDMDMFRRMNLLPPEHMVLIPGSGVNCERFKPQGQPPRVDGFKVLLPARVLWDKGVGEFVEAARQVQANGGGVQFLIAGEPDPGNPTAVPLSEIRAWQSAGLVTWLGHVADMAALYQQVHAVVLPSYREGLPKGLIEAGAAGLPLIATDVPGCNQVVRHDENGLVVPVRDAAALAQAVLKLRDDPALCETFGAAARAHVLQHFEEASVNQRTRAVYGLLARAPGSHSQRLPS